MELAILVRYFMQINGNFDLTVIFTGIAIPTTLREIDWPKASFAKASFSQFWSTLPGSMPTVRNLRLMNETFNERYIKFNHAKLINYFISFHQEWQDCLLVLITPRVTRNTGRRILMRLQGKSSIIASKGINRFQRVSYT